MLRATKEAVAVDFKMFKREAERFIRLLRELRLGKRACVSV